MAIDKKKLRAFLLREIASSNKRITSLMYSEAKSRRDCYNSGFNEILTRFAGDEYSESMKIIYNDIARNPKKSYAAYNYFDVDTLICYRAYLQSIITEVEGIALENRHRYPTGRDFRAGLNRVSDNLLKNEISGSAGLYDFKSPVKIAYSTESGSRKLDPQKALSREVFQKKYNYYDCKRELDEYIKVKFDERVKSKRSQEFATEEDREFIEYRYKGQKHKLVVNSKEYYSDEDGKGVVWIRASGKIGTLYGTYYSSGEVYNGDLYDYDGNVVEVDGGGEVFYESKVSSKAEQKPQTPEIDDGQMTIDF